MDGSDCNIPIAFDNNNNNNNNNINNNNNNNKFCADCVVSRVNMRLS